MLTEIRLIRIFFPYNLVEPRYTNFWITRTNIYRNSGPYNVLSIDIN